MAYSFKRSITIDHTKCGSSDSSSFPVLVGGAGGPYTYLKTAANGGQIQNTVSFGGQTVPADLIFTSDSAGTSLLSWEVASYNATTGDIEVWVKLSTVSHSSDTEFYMFYGNSAVSTYQGGSAGAAWNSGYAGVWHFPNGTTLALTDSTTNANSLTNHSATATAGQVDGAANFDGATQYANVASSTSLNQHDNLTFEAWFNSTEVIGRHVIIAKYNGSTAPYFWYLSGAHVNWFTGAAEYPDTATILVNTTTYVAFTIVGTTGTFYVNGVASAPQTVSNGATNASDVTVGDYSAGGGYFWPGWIDELRMSTGTARTADWILTSYNNQHIPDKSAGSGGFYTVGASITLGLVGPFPTHLNS